MLFDIIIKSISFMIAYIFQVKEKMDFPVFCIPFPFLKEDCLSFLLIVMFTIIYHLSSVKNKAQSNRCITNENGTKSGIHESDPELSYKGVKSSVSYSICYNTSDS